MARYRFNLNNGTESRICYPRWKDDTAISYTYETQQMFRRAQLSTNIVFVGSDYDWIEATDFEAEFNVQIEVDWNGSGTYQAYWSGMFHKTDCTFNADNKTVTVKPNTKDRYNTILAGLDKEFDLIKLTPAIQPIHLKRRPLLQIYTAGEEVVSCFLSTMTWEQECDAVTSRGRITGTFHFGRIGQYADFTFGDNTFVGTVQQRNGQGEWNDYGNNGTYQMNYYQEVRFDPETSSLSWYNGLRVYLLGTQTLIWEYDQTSDFQAYTPIPDEFTMVAKASGYQNVQVQQTKSDIYGRWCVAADMEGAYSISQEDILPYNRNYKYCVPYSGDDIIQMTYNAQEQPTEWGIRDDGMYYVKPMEDTFAYRYYPVARSQWRNSSLWYLHTIFMENTEATMRVDTLLRDAFTLEAVIKALLHEIDPTIQFEGTQSYSRFLFGRNPLFGDAWGRLAVTPKSNILVAEYTQPARKAEITLGSVLKMLCNACGCYWYINDANQFIIEHISWFKNGGSYSGQQAIGIDMTGVVNTRNGKPIIMGTNEYSYDKLEMPERYEYSWADDTTMDFKGEPIEVVSKYVEAGKIEEINIADFNSDIDYMMLNPSTVSEDGFALMCCDVVNGEYSLTINNVDAYLTKCQNWQLSMKQLQPAFLISDMPSWHIKVWGEATTAKGIQRKKKQKINIPIGNTEPNVQLLVKTGVGVGEIEQMEISLTSRMAKTILRYDTTQQ